VAAAPVWSVVLVDEDADELLGVVLEAAGAALVSVLLEPVAGVALVPELLIEEEELEAAGAAVEF
jgi:hypothetical protein